MCKISILVISVFLFVGCKQKSIIHPTFYYWRTDYQNKNAETDYLDQFKSKSLYVRIMDVDFNPGGVLSGLKLKIGVMTTKKLRWFFLNYLNFLMVNKSQRDLK